MSSKKKTRTKSAHKTAKACRICLAMDRKLYQMKKYNLYLHYEEITGLRVKEKDRLPQKLCWECAHRLITCHRFKKTAVKTHSLLTEMLHTTNYITSQNITSINRHKNNLISYLTEKYIPANYTDLHLENTDDNVGCSLIDMSTGDIKRESCDSDSNHFDDASNFMLERKEKDKSTKIDRRRKPARDILSDTIFDITDLSYEEQVLDINKRRDTGNFKNSAYKCSVCFKGFLDENAFKGHIFRHTEESGTYVCDICKIRFSKRHALRNHMTSHMQKFTCKMCPYVTTRRHAAKLHEEYHNGTKYQCPHCQEDFVKISTYMSHVRIKHPSDFVCDICGYSFVSAKGLSLHKQWKHRATEHPIPQDGPTCTDCDVRFANKEALDRHLKLSTKHNNVGNLRKRSRRSRDIETVNGEKKRQNPDEKNRNSCKPEGPISCEQCNLQLPDSLSYYRHFRRSHPDKNRTNYPSMKTKSMCEVCGKMFQSLALLKDHSSTHSEARQFSCPVCHKRFQRRYRLVAHGRLHAPRAPPRHACALCGKHFTTASNMQRHMSSHTGLRPFKCEMCGKCFKHASEKRVHVTYVHMKKPWPKRSRGKRRDDRPDQIPPPLNPQSDLTAMVQPVWTACDMPKLDITSYKTNLHTI